MAQGGKNGQGALREGPPLAWGPAALPRVHGTGEGCREGVSAVEAGRADAGRRVV